MISGCDTFLVFPFLFSRGVGHTRWSRRRHRKTQSVSTAGFTCAKRQICRWSQAEMLQTPHHYPCRKVRSWPPVTALVCKQYLNVEHTLTLVKIFAADCHIIILPTHTYVTTHRLISHTHTHTLPVSVYTACLLAWSEIETFTICDEKMLRARITYRMDYIIQNPQACRITLK